MLQGRSLQRANLPETLILMEKASRQRKAAEPELANAKDVRGKLGQYSFCDWRDHKVNDQGRIPCADQHLGNPLRVG